MLRIKIIASKVNKIIKDKVDNTLFIIVNEFVHVAIVTEKSGYACSIRNIPMFSA